MHKQSQLVLFEAIATLVGTIIGAGILGIPFVFAQAGFWTGTLVLVVIGLAMLLMKLMYGEITLRTHGNHQLAGYTEIYLGKLAKYVMSFILITGLYGSLLAYIIGQGKVIEAITGISSFWASIGFLAVFAIFVYIGLSIIKRTELLMTGIIFAIIIVIAILSFDHINLSNLEGFDLKLIFVPYGVLLFACSGLTAIPPVKRILSHQRHLIKPAIIWGCLIPPVLYFLFTVLVLTVSGIKVTEVASVGLGQVLGWKMILIANVFAFFTMATSFLTAGMALRNVYDFDYNISRFLSWFLVVSVPLIIFLIGARDFVKVISIVGSLSVGAGGIIAILTFWRAKKKGKRKPEFEVPGLMGVLGGALLIIIFIGGVIYVFAEGR